ncbi:hypothetical protein [Desertimonas flava]|uniref:hypothetical protein n=1 Tax=Desertimonas flava TaxID=2064846 RepID=UPI000E343B34|nr:hypothetical protein [Desertimonas flava]
MSEDRELVLFGPDDDPVAPDRARVKYSSKDTTLISELATALGMIRRTLPEAIAHLPSELVGVSPADWDALTALHAGGRHAELFEHSFANGRAFATSEAALRHRQPGQVEWSGPRKIRGEGAIPADLRVDDVYLVSCKYGSKNLLNSGLAKLFDNRLRDGVRAATSWYEDVAGEAYQRYYAAVRAHFAFDDLASDVTTLTDGDRMVLAGRLERELPAALVDEQAAFCRAVSEASAARWRRSIGSTQQQRGDFAMSLLRIPQAVYFLLGRAGRIPLRFKVLSRWDWATRYEMRNFAIAATTALQPTVDWELTVLDRLTRTESSARGHVEIRWSHGRFNKAPEAKVYLDSPLHATPGYVSLD